MTSQLTSEAAAVRAAFDDAVAAIQALPDVEAFDAAQDLLNELRVLVRKARDLRDMQVARLYDTGRMTLVELAEKTQWGADRTGRVTRGRMHQIVTRGRQLLAAQGIAMPPRSPKPAAVADSGVAVPPPRVETDVDAELDTMSGIIAALSQLDPATQSRIVAWLQDRYQTGEAS